VTDFERGEVNEANLVSTRLIASAGKSG